jgi:hypothetical protein
MTRELDLFELEQIADQTAFSFNEGDRDRRSCHGGATRHKIGHMGVSLGLQRAKVARAAPDSPAPAAGPPEANPAPKVEPAVPRVITTRDELLDLIQRRRDELKITHETIDALTGWASGYASKLLCNPPMKGFGKNSLDLILGALALGIAQVTFVEDPDAVKRMSGRWLRRRRPLRASTSGALISPGNREKLASTTEDDPNVEAQHIVPPET